MIDVARPGQADADRCAITGVRDDGYHLIDAEMVTLDLADVLTIDPGGDGITVERAVRRRRADRRVATSSPGRSALAGRTRRRARRQADPPRRRARRRLGRRRGGAALGRVRPTSSRPSRLGADVPFCLVGGRARVRGIGEIVEPLPPRAAGRSRSSCRRCTSARRRSTGRGTTLGGPTADGPNDLEPAALVVEPALARWRDRIGELRRRRAGAGRQRGDVVRAGRARRRPRRLAERGRCGGGGPHGASRRTDRAGWTRASWLLAALVAGAPEHLLVLLLAHPLAALLDQRTHKAGQATGRSEHPRDTGGRTSRHIPTAVPGSFNR